MTEEQLYDLEQAMKSRGFKSEDPQSCAETVKRWHAVFDMDPNTIYKITLGAYLKIEANGEVTWEIVAADHSFTRSKNNTTWSVRHGLAPDKYLDSYMNLVDVVNNFRSEADVIDSKILRLIDIADNQN